MKHLFYLALTLLLVRLLVRLWPVAYMRYNPGYAARNDEANNAPSGTCSLGYDFEVFTPTYHYGEWN